MMDGMYDTHRIHGHSQHDSSLKACVFDFDQLEMIHVIISFVIFCSIYLLFFFNFTVATLKQPPSKKKKIFFFFILLLSVSIFKVYSRKNQSVIFLFSISIRERSQRLNDLEVSNRGIII